MTTIETTTDQYAALEQRTVRPLGRVLVTGAASGLGEVDDDGRCVGEGGHRVRARVDPVEQER